MSHIGADNSETHAASSLSSSLDMTDKQHCVCVCAGLDYVAHEDLLPYTTVEQAPIQHELFDKFLMHDPESSE